MLRVLREVDCSSLQYDRQSNQLLPRSCGILRETETVLRFHVSPGSVLGFTQPTSRVKSKHKSLRYTNKKNQSYKFYFCMEIYRSHRNLSVYTEENRTQLFFSCPDRKRKRFTSRLPKTYCYHVCTYVRYAKCPTAQSLISTTCFIDRNEQ